MFLDCTAWGVTHAPQRLTRRERAKSGRKKKGNDDRQADEFGVKVDDPRFYNSLMHDKRFTMDTTSAEFVKSEGPRRIMEERLKRNKSSTLGADDVTGRQHEGEGRPKKRRK